MNYAKHYYLLVTRGQLRETTDGYYERHHIVPRCVGGTDESDNLVKLTPEEHYLAHLLLCKIYNNHYGLVRAAMMMCAKRPSNKVYGWLRRRHAKAMSVAQKGIKNSQYGSKWIHKNGIAVNLDSSELQEYVSDGWETGRKKRIVKEKRIRQHERGKNYKWFNEQESAILEEFDNHGSITKILHSRGYTGRAGNLILSKWLKARGRVPLKRRNSAGFA